MSHVPHDAGPPRYDAADDARDLVPLSLPPPLPLDPPGGEPPVAQVAPAAPAVRFCGTCGSPWLPDWVWCEACAARQAARAAGATGSKGARGEPEGISRIKSSLGLYFTLLSVSMVMIVALTAEADEPTVDIAGTFAMSVVVLLWCAAGGAGRSIVGSFKVGPLWGYAVAPLLAAGTVAVAFVVIETMHRTLDLEKLTYSGPFLEAGYGLWVVFVLVAVQPAVFEELAFRGVVLTSLVPTLSETEAVFVSALLFMTLHLSPAAFPHTFAMGVAAAFLRLRTGSLLPCILLHFLHNAAVIGAEVYLGI